jgi:hypothetical protein
MHVLGIAIEGQSVKAVCLDKRGGLRSCQTFAVSEISTWRKRFSLKPWQWASVVCGVQATDVLLRQIVLPLQGKRKLRIALPFALEGALPMSEERSLVSAWNFVREEAGTRASLFVVKEHVVRAHLERYASWGIFPDCMSCEPLAFFAVCKHLYPDERELLAFHVGQESAFWIYVRDGELHGSHPFQKEHQFSQEAQRICAFLKERKKCNMSVLASVFFGKQLEKIPNVRLLQPPEAPYFLYAIPIGLAYASKAYPVQFIQKLAMPKSYRVRRKKQMVGLCCIVVIGIAWLGLGEWGLLMKKRMPLLTSIQEVTGNVVRREKEVAATLANREQELRVRQQQWLLSKSPKVARLLAWLSTHPMLATPEGSPIQDLEIVRVHTWLESFPTKERSMTPYKMIAEIILETEKPELADQFHNALKQGDSFIDDKDPILWEAHAPSYKAVFTVQNR